MCVGSYASIEENDVIAMVDEFASKINFVHLRNVEKQAENRSFVESDHLGGDVDMYKVGGEHRYITSAFQKLYSRSHLRCPRTRM